MTIVCTNALSNILSLLTGKGSLLPRVVSICANASSAGVLILVLHY